MRSYNCGEPSHKQHDCKKVGKRPSLLVGTYDLFEWLDDVGEAIFDEFSDGEGDNVGDEEYVGGDTGLLLVVRRPCLFSKCFDDEWLRTNIFLSTYTVNGKVCRFVVDSDSCENIVSEEAVQKLGLKTEKHPKPYKLAWLQKGSEVTVFKLALISFSIGTNYKVQILCDVMVMDACHLLLGRPWQYDRQVQHDGCNNTYSFMFHSKKIVLLPNKEPTSPKPITNLLSLASLQTRWKNLALCMSWLVRRPIQQVLFPSQSNHY